MSLKDAAARAAYMNVITKAVTAEDKAARADLAAEFKAERERTGTKSCDASLPDGTGIGSVTFVQPKAAAALTDADAFARWVKATYPSEVAGIRLVIDVQPAFLKRVLAEVTAAGVPQIADKETGEIHDVPGVAVTGRAGYVRVTVPDDGEAAVMDALRSGGLASLILPALAPAAEPETAGGECRAREPEPRTGTQACVRPAGHGGSRHRDHWGNEWPTAPAADDTADGGEAA